MAIYLLAAATSNGIDGPLTPQESLKYLKTEPGLRVELVAAEPMVVDPVAVAWDEKGRMFVVEDRGYPTGPGKGKPPVGQVVMLEDTDGDGKYDKRTVYADGLTFPNGVMCWNGGIYVTCAPYLYYFKDTKGDGKADVKQIVFKGFQDLSTTQLRVSHPTLNIDNWVYLTSGLTAAKVTSPAHTNRPAVFLNRVDGRFRPGTDDIEETSGTAQFGQTFDRFGRKFICSNRNHIQQVVMQIGYLKRNPNLPFSGQVEDIPDHEAACRVYPLSANITTAAFHTGYITSACGISIYDGTGLPEDYRGNSFNCEPAGNLVHRDVLSPNGVTYIAKRAYPTNEFLASPDNWFRAVNLANGPDGAIYVCDMYRKTIEHPDYLPEATRKITDFESGKGMGRIYRVVADKAQRHGVPALAGETRPTPDSGQKSVATGRDNVLQRGDTLTIAFSDLPATISPFEVRLKDDNTVTLPFNETFIAGGKTPSDLEKEIRERYVPKFYRNLTVSVELTKPFQFVHGNGDFTDFSDRRTHKAPGSKFDLGRMTCQQLVSELNNPNIWWRMTAQRLLLERQDAKAVPYLKSLCGNGKTPEARVHALRTLEGLNALDEDQIVAALVDKHPGVREHGIQLAEPRLAGSAALAARLLSMADDPDARVRFQCALSLGQLDSDKIIPPLVAISTQGLSDKWTRAAVLSAINRREEQFLHQFLAVASVTNTTVMPAMMEELSHIVAAAAPPPQLAPLLRKILALKDPAELSWQMAAVSGFADGLRARSSTATDPLTVKSLSADDSDLRQKLDRLFKHSTEMAGDANATMSARLAAIGLLGQAEYPSVGQMLEGLVGPQQPPEIQTAAVRALGQMSDANAGSALVTRERWNGYTPAVRDAVLSALVANTNFLHSLFAAIEKGDVAARTVNGDRRAQLMKNKDEAIKTRAIALFKDMTTGDRMKVYEETKSILALKPDPKKGHAVFQKNCIPCHVVSGEGKVVGPDLTGIRNQPSEVLLLHIVVPEYEIMPIYTCYNVETKDGQSYTGLLAAETPNAITLRMAQAIEQKIPRDQIASMVTSRLSLMPQELEKAMSKQDLADLIGFLKSE